MGRPLRGAHLFGAAEALRQAIHALLTGTIRAYFERLVAIGRGRGDPGSFAAAWAEGSALAEGQAISLALAVDEPKDPETAQPGDRTASARRTATGRQPAADRSLAVLLLSRPEQPFHFLGRLRHVHSFGPRPFLTKTLPGGAQQRRVWLA